MDRVATRLVAVGIGSNLGDRVANLAFARRHLERLLTAPLFSSVRETDPVGVPDPQPPYLNAVALGSSTASPRQLLDGLLAIEQACGRQRPHPNAARTLDLDLLLVGDLMVDEPGLVLPHPRMHQRVFVLEPLLELERTRESLGGRPWHHPVTGRAVAAMLAALTRLPPALSETRR